MAYVYVDTDEKLVEIFSEHCNLSPEQYEVIRAEFINLECDMMDGEPQAEIEKRMEKMRIIFDFLLETKEITLEEHAGMNDLISQKWKSEMDRICEAILKEGTVL